MRKNIKAILWEECRRAVENSMTNAHKELEELQRAAEGETKSSAGDKYETGREMMQLESSKYEAQMAEAMKWQKVLHQINVEKEQKTADLGSLVKTSQGIFFLIFPLGKCTVESHDYFVISPASPIGTLLKGKRKGDFFHFREKKYEILEIV